MKHAILGILSLCLLSFSVTDPITPLPIGSSLPMADHKVKDVSGKEVDLKSAVAENGLLVIFSCNTCPYVVKNERRINQLVAVTQNNSVGMIILNSNEAYRNGDDSYPAMQEYAIQKKLTCFYAVDETNILADAFGATRTPECFLFDKNLKLVYHGAIDDNVNDQSGVKRKHVEVAMKEMMRGESVSMPETKSIGCGIKRKS
jgi:hypothetical protein